MVCDTFVMYLVPVILLHFMAELGPHLIGSSSAMVVPILVLYENVLDNTESAERS